MQKGSLGHELSEISFKVQTSICCSKDPLMSFAAVCVTEIRKDLGSHILAVAYVTLIQTFF